MARAGAGLGRRGLAARPGAGALRAGVPGRRDHARGPARADRRRPARARAAAGAAQGRAQGDPGPGRPAGPACERSRPRPRRRRRADTAPSPRRSGGSSRSCSPTWSARPRSASRLDPEEMREVLRAYQDAVAGEVARFEGHVAKFMGDGVLAYFGWPSAHEDEAERAVRAGLAAVQAVGRLTTPAGEPLAARVGIAHRAGRGRRSRRRGLRRRSRRSSARRRTWPPACRPWPSPARW